MATVETPSVIQTVGLGSLQIAQPRQMH
eukprot:SAG31_NODE_43013_length_269_cov_0.605882_1_plen_27_part_10